MERGRDILALVAPGLVWALHFIAVYALISAACAPRALIDMGAIWLWGGIATGIALVAAGAPLLMRTPAPLRRALTYCVAIALVAILADAAFLYLFPSCGG